ncbi:unnamed protein product [Clonostachys chloroleuca]|uniref:Zn(2)-C6 fungal-type domain-containing protein n=1 Tax=Clonostachys chloroleuca TaxID=1926264 RepID=A0AA35QC46_9HYPO|nr:unnamed protein product [Clonostachys chloroleuca]
MSLLPPIKDTSAADEDATATPSRKRRKIRKGTQSCWECKRRKIRCTFATPAENTCDGCRSRRTKCISQEFDYENTLEHLHGKGRNVAQEPIEGGTVDKPLVATRAVSPLQTACKSRQGEWNTDAHGMHLPATTTILSHPSGGDKPSELWKSLLAAWPSPKDLDILLETPMSSSVLFHGVVCRPFSELMSQNILSPRQMLQSPTQEMHPILIARKLLLLATFLQGIPADNSMQIPRLSKDARSIMSTAFRVATRLETEDDDALTSIEGLECIMMESMYLNNAGNLRRAWLTNKRAISMAQLLRLHSSSSPPAPVIEEETRHRVRPDYMWARLIMSDRYLSLLLGLPHVIVNDDVFALPEVLEHCDAVDRMERLQAVVGGLILQRNMNESMNTTSTQSIDQMLQDASAVAPSCWWLPILDLNVMVGNDAKALREAIRIMSHFTHHHLLLQVHLPYLALSPYGDERYDYNKITAANTSRTILTQFVSFRKIFTSSAYCRGIDFIAFIASTVLCIAHIQSRRRHSCVGAFQSLQHQRLSDRALLDQTLDIMNTMAERTGDSVAAKVSSILNPLLVIENESSAGRPYSIWTSLAETMQESFDYHAEARENGHAIRIQVPYLGTIVIENRPAEIDPEEPLLFLANSHLISTSSTAGQPVPHPTGYQVTNVLPANPDWQAVPSQLCVSGPSIEHTMTETSNQSYRNTNSNKAPDSCLLVPGLDANVEEWALQGVDLALFSTLTHDFQNDETTIEDGG